MTSFLVIGGGIAGASAAARLAALGRVTLLEAEGRPGHHASSRSAAMFIEGYGAPEVRALNRASRDELFARGVLSPRGVLLVGGEGEDAAFAVERDEGGMEEVGVAEAARRCPLVDPGAVTRAAWADAFDLDADRLLQGFLREAKGLGAEVTTGAPVTSIARTGTAWRVATPKGDVEAAVLVNAAGAWADGVAAMAGLPPLGLTPLRRSMARVPAPEDPTGWPMLLGAGEAWYVKPDAGALLVSPGEEDPAEAHDAWADDLVLAEGIARAEARLSLRVTRLLASWAGLRTFAPDRRLVLGPDPLDPAFVWCAGQGGYGFQTCAAASAHLADLAAGRAPALGDALAAALSPARFR